MTSKRLVAAARGRFTPQSKLLKFAVLGTAASVAVVAASTAAPRHSSVDAENARHAP
jgi:hypothetical protein